LVLAAYIAYTYLNQDEDDDWFDNNVSILPSVFTPKVPEKTNFLILGVDADETRTDTIMVGNFNSVNKKVSIISIPRDTIVTVPPDRWKVMCENFPRLANNTSREIKINAVHNYAGEDHNVEFLEKQLEEMLDIKLDYYVKVNCEAFRYIVDSIGGIEFNVEGRLKYDDPDQDLHIDLYPGLQLLDGDKAEQLVRYRKGYAMQDLHRVEVQQQFMQVFLATALNKDTILSNPTVYLTAMFKYIDTDLTIADAVKYMKYLSDFNASDVETYTLPGEPNEDGDFIINEEEVKSLVYDVFKKPSTETEQKAIQEDSFGKSIQLLNGGYTKGMARSKKEELEQKGYTVDNIGDYMGDKNEITKIYVSKEGQGNDLQQFFKKSKIYIDPTKTKEYDIVVVIGTSE